MQQTAAAAADPRLYRLHGTPSRQRAVAHPGARFKGEGQPRPAKRMIELASENGRYGYRHIRSKNHDQKSPAIQRLRTSAAGGGPIRDYADPGSSVTG